jgi:hypothetical protein
MGCDRPSFVLPTPHDCSHISEEAVWRLCTISHFMVGTRILRQFILNSLCDMLLITCNSQREEAVPSLVYMQPLL